MESEKYTKLVIIIKKEAGISLVPQLVKDLELSFGGSGSIHGLVQWVKDLVLPPLWHRSQLWLGFYP